MERFKKALKDIPSTVLRQERRWNRMEQIEEGFKRFRTKVILFAATVAIVIDLLVFIQMGVI
jgi:hypothetical protein